jgi:Holliday junction resolvase RusA-like endonuclease
MRRNKHTLRLSRSQFQEFQKNRQDLAGKNNSNDRPSKKTKNGYDDQCVIFVTFYISDNRDRDLDGMVSTVFDCLVRSGKIPEDKRQVVPMFITDYEIVEKKQVGCRIRIITNENK